MHTHSVRTIVALCNKLSPHSETMEGIDYLHTYAPTMVGTVDYTAPVAHAYNYDRGSLPRRVYGWLYHVLKTADVAVRG